MNDKQQKSIFTVQLGFQSFWKIERFVQLLNKFILVNDERLNDITQVNEKSHH